MRGGQIQEKSPAGILPPRGGERDACTGEKSAQKSFTSITNLTLKERAVNIGNRTFLKMKQQQPPPPPLAAI